MDLLYSIWASDLEAKRILFSFLFSRSYSNISMNLRCRLLRGFKNIFLRIPKLIVKFYRCQVQLFTTWMIFKLLSLNLVCGHSKFDIWIPAVASESPLLATAAIVNKCCRLQRGFSVSAVGYTADSSISAVGYSANFELPVAYIADL